MIGLFMQHMDTEALPGVASTVFGTKPSGRLREFPGKGCHLVGDPARITFFRGNRAQIAHIVVKAVGRRHEISPGQGRWCRSTPLAACEKTAWPIGARPSGCGGADRSSS